MNETFIAIAAAIIEYLGTDAKCVIAARGSRCPLRPPYVKEPKEGSDWDIAVCIDTPNFTLFMDKSVNMLIADKLGLSKVDIQWSKPQINSYSKKHAFVPADYFWAENIITHQNWTACPIPSK